MTKTSQRRYLQPPGDLLVEDALRAYAALPGETRKIQLLRPFGVYSKNTYSTVVTLPIGPAYLAAVLERAGYNVGIIDAQGEDIQNLRHTSDGRRKIHGLGFDEIVRRIDANTSILGVSMMFSQEWLEHRELIAHIKRCHPDLTIVAGGEHVTAVPEHVLRGCPAIDFIVRGEGEMPLLELTSALMRGESTTKIGGVCYLTDDGTFVSNGLSRRIVDLDSLPRPAWHLCRVESYFTGHWTPGVSHGRNMPIIGTRGCPYQCTFCSNPLMWTTRYVMRDPSLVADEFEDLVSTHGANSVDFLDLTAIVQKRWIIAFCDELKRRGTRTAWQLPSGTRSEALDAEALQALYDTGLSLIVYAPESASAETLQRIKKRVRISRLSKSVRTALGIGHVVKINLIIGFPHESRRSMWQTLGFAVRMAVTGVHDCNIAVFSPYPGSELFDELVADGSIPELDDGYYEALLAQFDFTVVRSYVRGISGFELGAMRIVGMGLFYAISYLARPRRGLSLIARIVRGNFAARNLFEQRVSDFLERRRLGRRDVRS